MKDFWKVALAAFFVGKAAKTLINQSRAGDPDGRDLFSMTEDQSDRTCLALGAVGGVILLTV